MSYATYEEDYKNQEEVERIRKNMILLENASKKNLHDVTTTNNEEKNKTVITTIIEANLRINQEQYEYGTTYITIEVPVENNQNVIPVIIQELKDKDRYASVIQQEITFESFKILSHLSKS